MEMDLEKVEKLRTKANITYEEAKEALQKTNGDLLEAVIELERQGKIKEPSGGGYYSSRDTKSDETIPNPEGHDYHNNKRGHRGSHSHRHLIKDFLRWCGKIIQKGNANYLDVTKSEEAGTTSKLITSVPLTLLAILVIFAFWVTIPLLIILMFLGYRYSFRGPEAGRDDLNRVMDKAAETVGNIKAEVKEGME